MKLFDLHCDTSTRLLSEKQGLLDNSFHISINKAKYLKKYAQVMAIWSHHKLTDAEAYERFFEVVSNLENETKLNSEHVGIAKSSNDIYLLFEQGKIPLILSVEDARILENDLGRLDILYNLGVRTLTLNWYGLTCIGGAHDTDTGLSKFGESVVRRCFEIGIIPDISHSSFKGAEMTLDIAEVFKKPVIASHSDAYAINPHTRNLRDCDFKRIKELGGIVGINLCPSHLSSNGDPKIADIIRHIDHYLSLGGENTIAMGGDLDGTNLPNNFKDISDIHKIATEMHRLNYSSELIDKIMFKNAQEFFSKSI